MKFYIETYGCQMNVADSELVTAILMEAGNQAVSTIDAADAIIFNTCSVRQHAEDRVLGRISSELKRKRENPQLKIGIIGCMAQRVGEELVKQGLGLDFAVGVDQYALLPQVLQDSEHESYIAQDDLQIYPSIQPSHGSGFCGFVTIMRGCNNFCSYCIVPYVRGRERSRPLEEIEQDIQLAASKGILDITLLGQSVNSYQYQSLNFPQLLTRLNKKENISRLRFITSHPKDLSEALIDAMASCDKVCEHIHLPMQSGDNETLHRMNRGYTIEHYLGLINKLRQAIPGIAITTDIIAGFPGETETQIDNTVRAMQQISFDYAFCFKYSNRKGTAAADYVEQVDEEIRLLRLQKLIGIQRYQTAAKFNAQVGKTVEVLVEGTSRQGGKQISGKTRDFKICAFDGSREQIGQLIKVRVTSATSGTLIGEQVSDAYSYCCLH
jgi:tRNA-2-methylthio-N6-dimethylallyladenosine synthase